jgi:MFS family permease
MDTLAQRNIPLLRWFYAAQESVVMTVPVIVFYWLSKGLSMADILFLQAAYAATVAILEVPSGYISDWFSRRTSLLVSAGFLALGLWGYLISYDFLTFLLSELCFGFAVSFYSGTLESIAYESHAESVRDTEGRRSWARVME